MNPMTVCLFRRRFFTVCQFSFSHLALFLRSYENEHMLFIKEKSSLDNRVGRFGVAIFFAVVIYFLFGIIDDVSRFLE